MSRLFAVVVLVQLSFGQAASPTATASDPQAISIAQQAIKALTGSQVVGDVTLNASVTFIQGSTTQTGTAVFRAAGPSQSRVDLNLSGGTLSEARNASNGAVAGSWSKNGARSIAQASHNLLTDASWFFPGLCSLTQAGGSSQYVFKYVGQEQHGGVNTQHIQVSLAPVAGAPFLPQLSATDFYLSTANALPVAIDFNVHPDKDMNKNIPVEILFANYQAFSGLQVPFHFQKLLNGGVVLDATVTSVTLNSGLATSTFTLP